MRFASIAAILFFFLQTVPAHAEILEATFTPSSALVKERLQAAPDADGAVTHLLPVQADPESLTVLAAPPARVLDVSWQRVRVRDETAVKDLEIRIRDAKREKTKLLAQAASLDGQLGFWKGLRLENADDPAKAAALAEELGKRIPPLAEDRALLDERLEQAEKQLAELQRRMQELTGSQKDSWEVRVVLEDAPQNADLTLGYTLADAGWSPVYRLQAEPGNGRIRLDFDARIWQRSGRDLSAARIMLATLPPRVRLNPPSLRDWNIGPRRARLLSRAVSGAPQMSADAMDSVQELAMSKSAMVPPEPTDRTTYRVWNLGPRTIAAGPQQKLNIQKLILKADYTRLLRPALDSRAFLRAAFTADEALDLPPGEALFMVDGTVVAKQPLALSGTEGTLFFGTDPLVKAQVVQLTRAGGERGFFNQKQTAQWRWRLVLTNDRSEPVHVRVEEPEPQPGDERIELNVTAKPAPDSKPKDTPPEDEHLLIWNLDLAAKSEKSITWGVELSAPQDLDLDLGWR